MELSNGDKNHSLPLCVYVVGFGKSDHILHMYAYNTKYAL